MGALSKMAVVCGGMFKKENNPLRKQFWIEAYARHFGYETPHQVVKRLLKTNPSMQYALWWFEILTMATCLAIVAILVLTLMASMVWACELVSREVLGEENILFTTFLGLCCMLAVVKFFQIALIRFTSQSHRSE